MAGRRIDGATSPAVGGTITLVQSVPHFLGFVFLREPFNGLTHLAAALASVLALRYLRQRLSACDDGPKRRSLTFFGWSLILLFAASALYHLADLPPQGLVWMRRADHAAIFVLIVGTYTGICFNVLPGAWRKWILSLVWIFGLAGIVEKVGFLSIPEAFSTGLYMGLGWIGILAYPVLARTLGHSPLVWIVLGGLTYTGGACIDFLRWPAEPWGVLGHHEIFHLTVVAAAALHFCFVARHVVGFSRASHAAGRNTGCRLHACRLHAAGMRQQDRLTEADRRLGNVEVE